MFRSVNKEKKFEFLLKLFNILFFLTLSFSLIVSPAGAISYYSWNTSGPKHAGGFYILEGLGGSFLGQIFSGGGTVFLDWRDLEPVEGEYHWELLDEVLYNSWKQYNDCKCDNPPLIRSPGHYFSASSVRKTVRFKLHITDGAVPLWLFGGTGRKEGTANSSYGYICAHKVLEEGMDCKGNSDPENIMNNDIVISHPYPSYPDFEDAVHPVWWNKMFQEKLQKTLTALGQKIASDPKYYEAIEFVEASVGNFGEMILYGKGDYNEDGSFNYNSFGVTMWKAAGYTNARYSEAVLKILGIYIDAFPNLPVALSTGAGLYPGGQGYDDGSGVISVEPEVITKAMERWGGRLYLKFAGFGAGGGSRAGLFRTYCPSITKCIYESYGGMGGWQIGGKSIDQWTPSDLGNIFKYAVDDHAYIVMLWHADWPLIVQYNLQSALLDWGYKLAPNIRMRDGNNGVVFDKQSLPAGSPLTITTKWKNDFSHVSLFKPKRFFNALTGTYKETPSSYPIYFDLVDNSGNVVFRTTYIPQKGTETWTLGAGDIDTADTIFVPWNVPPGQYTPRIGIVLNDEMTLFWNIGGRDSSEVPPYPISTKKITITSPAGLGFSLKTGWNKITWPSVSGLTTEQIQSACQIFAKNGFGESAFVKDFSVMPLTFLSGEGLFFKCRQALW